MGILEDFPTDPFFPSLRYAAFCLNPFVIPWGSDVIRLGTSLSVPPAPNEKAQFSDCTAFAPESLALSRLIVSSSSAGFIAEAGTFGSSSKSEHTDFSVAAQVGGSFLGANGQVRYETYVGSEDSGVLSSLRTTYRCGKVSFLEIPSLSSRATDILRNSKNPRSDFDSEFGQYYVAAYLLGGSNSNLFAGKSSGSSSSKDLSGSVTVNVFFISGTKALEEHEGSLDAHFWATLNAFDSLESSIVDRVARDPMTFRGLMQAAGENGSRCRSLPSRVYAKACELGLNRKAEVSWTDCDGICSRGLVVEAIMMPYASLHDYISAISANLAASNRVE